MSSCMVDVNWVHQSLVTVAGTLKLATHPAKKTSLLVATSVSLSSIASTHLVVLTMAVRMYACPCDEGGRGPTRSMWTSLNL
jgi:hypothetical protein